MLGIGMDVERTSSPIPLQEQEHLDQEYFTSTVETYYNLLKLQLRQKAGNTSVV